MDAASQSETTGFGPHRKVSVPEIFCLLTILSIAAFVRFYGLRGRGICTSDGGHYAHQAWLVLEGRPEAIKDKPGHTLSIVVAFKLFGLEMTSPLYLAALSGLLSVVLVWLTIRSWHGPAPGCLTAALAAFMPYPLSYQRSALSDSHLFTLLFAGVFFFCRALQRLERPGQGYLNTSLDFGLPGLMFGLALSVNYSMATTFVPVLLTLGLLLLLRGDQLRKIMAGGLSLLLASALGYGLVLAVMWPYIEHRELLRQIGYHGGAFARSTPSFRPLQMLLAYAGLPPMLLAIVGLWRMARQRRWCDLFGLVLTGLMGLAYFRAPQTYPRVYLPLCLPVLIACGSGFRALLEILPGRKALQNALAALILLATLAFQWPQFYAVVTLRSGYPEACRTLQADGLVMGGTTHSWWTFQAFTGHPFGYCSDEVAKKLGAENWDSELVRVFQQWERKGFTHVVIDYMLWNRVYLAGGIGLEEFNRRLARFLELHPPAFRISDPAAGDPQTVAEDGGLPEAGTNPLSEYIYIFRLSDF